MPQAPSSQNDAFGEGINHVVNEGRANAGSLSLAQDSARFNSQVSAGATVPHSLLLNVEPNPGGNGMSAQDAGQRSLTGEFLGSGIGQSVGSFRKSVGLRFSGDTNEPTA